MFNDRKGKVYIVKSVVALWASVAKMSSPRRIGDAVLRVKMSIGNSAKTQEISNLGEKYGETYCHQSILLYNLLYE